jgi:hypothetical protein
MNKVGLWAYEDVGDCCVATGNPALTPDNPDFYIFVLPSQLGKMSLLGLRQNEAICIGPGASTQSDSTTYLFRRWPFPATAQNDKKSAMID